MKIISTFLCFFLLLMLLGSLSYIGLLWKHYWIRLEKLERDQRVLKPRKIVYYNSQAKLNFDEVTNRFVVSSTLVDHHVSHTRQTTAATPKRPITAPSPTTTVSPEKIRQKVAQHEFKIINQLRNVVADTGLNVKHGKVKNSYKVHYNYSATEVPPLPQQPANLICSALSEIQLETFVKGNSFFQSQELDQFLPDHQLLRGKIYNTCGIVPNPGSLLDSNLGSNIDQNDFVIRFNNAPTVGKYAKDVGTKTSLRIVNSQVVGKPNFGFLSHPLYKDVPLLVWDPSVYRASLDHWFAKPDYPFFETFFSKRLMKPKQEVHLLHPWSLWSIWEWMQKNEKYRLLPNPPSSGFLGIVLALRHCYKVNVYEFVPSLRLSDRCHYYEDLVNMGCTLGDWHPLAVEKLLALKMNVADRVQVFANGYITLPGLPSLNCSTSNLV